MDKTKNPFYALSNKAFAIKHHSYNVYLEFHRHVGTRRYRDPDFNAITKMIFKHLRGFKIIFTKKKL